MPFGDRIAVHGSPVDGERPREPHSYGRGGACVGGLRPESKADVVWVELRELGSQLLYACNRGHKYNVVLFAVSERGRIVDGSEDTKWKWQLRDPSPRFHVVKQNSR